MNQKEVENILNLLREKNELSYVEAKDSLADKNKIGETISALCNSASYSDQEYAYLIWGIEDTTWNLVDTKFDLEKCVQGKSGFIYPQIISAFNYKPKLKCGEFWVDGKRLYVLRIKNAGSNPLYFNKIAYIRIGEVIDELCDHPEIQKYLINKDVDWSGQVPEGSELDWIDEKSFDSLSEKYFDIKENKNKHLNKVQLLNALSLLDKNNKPNNTCLLFIGKKEIIDKVFGGKNKITWVYRDELNDIEERVPAGDQSRPLILGLYEILNKINKFNVTLRDLDLFRNDVLQYDNKAIEEILVNAIAHRDWNIDLWIEVKQTPISLEIINPGRFRADLNKVLSENKRPVYLNKNLAEFLSRINLMEKEGGGLRKVYESQIRKGLSVIPKFDNESVEPRVDFILSGRVRNNDFARFMFLSRDLTQDQVIVLDKIYSGKNIFGKDVDEREFNIVRNLVTKTGKGGSVLKIQEGILKKSKLYIDSFSNTYASTGTLRTIILDYASKDDQFSVVEIYGILKGKNKAWIRQTLMKMVNDGVLRRVQRGIYSLVRLPNKLNGKTNKENN